MFFGTQRINGQGHLEVGGVDVVELAGRFGTPLYVMDEGAVRDRCREYVEAFRKEAPDTAIAFASKAFLCRAAAQLAIEEGLELDVASVGELHVALRADVPPAKITFHGNFKKDEELATAIEAGVGLIVIDSTDEMRALSKIASEMGVVQRSLIRVAPGIDGHTLDAISTGRNDTKFGITAENGAAVAAIGECLKLPGIELVGLHTHIGSQIVTLGPFELLAEKMLDFSQTCSQQLGWTPGLLVLGGGLGIHYTPEEDPPSVGDLARTLFGGLRRAAASRNLEVPRIGIEPGRSIAGDFGMTVYRIRPIKTVPRRR